MRSRPPATGQSSPFGASARAGQACVVHRAHWTGASCPAAPDERERQALPPSPTAERGEAGGYVGDRRAAKTPAAGDDTETLFRQLVNDHQKRLYRFILKNIGNSADAEDLMQQAFAEAARSYATFRGESALSTWLYGIAMNLTRNYLSRAPHRKYGFENDESLEHLAADSVDPAEALAQRQALCALQRELAELPDEMREVLLLVALDELSYEEAAVMLSIPVGTVRSRVSRARTKLRQRLEEAGIELGF